MEGVRMPSTCPTRQSGPFRKALGIGKTADVAVENTLRRLIPSVTFREFPVFSVRLSTNPPLSPTFNFAARLVSIVPADIHSK